MMAVLPVTKNMNAKVGGQSGGSSYSLPSGASSAIGEKEALVQRWRSNMLRYETELRELASCSPSEPPTESRIIKVLQLFDCTTRHIDENLSPYLAELLRLFRIEFCRAIFSKDHVLLDTDPSSCEDGKNTGMANEGEVCTFFDQVDSLLRENAFLGRELKSYGWEENVVELKCEVERLKGNVELCENEIERLARQNDHLTKQFWEVHDKMISEQEAQASQVATLEKELRTAGVENKDLQLQLFRIRKEVTDGKTKLLTDRYKKLKISKMSLFTTLFSESDERVSILVLLSQLEFRLNEALDKYDDKYIMSHNNLAVQVSLHDLMEQDVVTLLEEMHLCELQYRRLTGYSGEPSSADEANTTARPSSSRFLQNPNTENSPDETDNFITMLFDFKIYNNLVSRATLRGRTLINTDYGGKKILGDPNPTGSFWDDTTRVQSDGSGGHGVFTSDTVSARAKDAFMTRYAESKDGETYGRDERNLRPPMSTLDAPMADESNLTCHNKYVFATRDEWIERMLGTNASINTSYVGQSRSGVCWTRQNAESTLSPDALLPRLLHRPLEDLCPRKFISSVDIFFGSDPVQQKLLCNIPHIDPALPIQLPKQTNFIKVKYKSALPVHDDDLDGSSGNDEAFPNVATEGERSEHTRPGEAAGAPARVTEAAHLHSRPNTGNAASPITSKSKPTQAARHPVSMQPFNKQAAKQIEKWGPRTRFTDEKDKNEAQKKDLFSIHDRFSVFHELCMTPFSKDVPGRFTTRITGSSTTSVLISFERLNPLSPNRAPEWMLYQTLFGGFRCLIPRVLDHAVIDHILLCTCERHFTRMGYRYMTCLKEAESRVVSSKMLLSVAERFFREAYELSDFQKSLVDELEGRYCYPELVAKTFYEILCFLDAAASHDALYNLYLEVIRGFQSPTHIHFACYMLFNMSYSWPSSDAYQVVSKDEALAMLRYLYRNSDIIVHVDVHEVLNDFERMSRSAPLTLNHMRSYIASVILNREETMLLYLQGLFRCCCIAEDLQKLTYENYSAVFLKHWSEKSAENGVVRFLTTTLGFNKNPFLSSDDLALVVASCWASNLIL